MLNRIIDISLKNRRLVLLMGVVLVAIGIALTYSMDVDVFPDLTAPTVTVLTEAHGMESEEVERLVTFPIETELNGSPHLRRIRSASSAGISIVWAEFDWGTDIYRARQIIGERLPGIRQKLPEDANELVMAPISSIMGEIMLLAVSSDSLSPMEVRTLADWEILPRLKSIQGVSRVVVIGGDYKQYQVLASAQKMRYFGVSLEELALAAERSNANSSGGFYSQYGNQYLIKGEGRAFTLSDISTALVKRIKGRAVSIGDVAEVKIGAADKIGEGSMNASPAVILTISKQPETNTLSLTKDIDLALEELRSGLPGNVQLNSRIFRQSDFIEASVGNLQTTLLEGAACVVVILFIFLWNWRTTFISLLAIPTSLLVSIIVLKSLGYTINTMSLGGMAIAIGALVDDAVIDVENVYKRLRQGAARQELTTKSMLNIVLEGSKEVRSSIVIATFIIIVAFVPLFFLGGMEGRLLKPLGIAFITAVLASLLVAVTITPVLCSYLLSGPRFLTRRSTGTPMERGLQRIYRSALRTVIRFPRTAIALAVAAFAGSLILFTQQGRDFLPDFNEGSLVISLVGPAGMSLEESNRIGSRAEELLLDVDEIHIVTRRTGRAELDEHAQGVNASEIDAPFVLNGRNRDGFLEDVRARLAVLPGVNVTVGQPIAHRVDHMLSGTRANIAIKVFGDDLYQLYKIAQEVKNNISGIGGLVDVSVEQQLEVPQIRIRPKPVLLAKYGLTNLDLAEFVDIAFAGEKVSTVYEGKRSFDMIVRLGETQRGSIESIKSALIDLPEGGKVPLENLARVESVSSPNTVSRENVMRKLVVSANVSGRDLRGAVNEIRDVLENNMDLPEGYFITYGGQFESEARASALLLRASVIAVFLIFALLFYEFKDTRLAGIVLLNLPLALIGGVVMVHLTTGIISIASSIGFISLFGIATRNGILLISRYQALERSGHSGLDMIIEGSADRLNPILMTALTTALALIPLALKGGQSGNEIQSPMAVVILGGLLSATLLNLFVIPCVYLLFRKDTSPL